MEKRIKAFAAAAILSVCLCVSAFAGNIPTSPAPADPPTEAQPTPTPTPTTEETAQSAGTAEEGILDWLLGLIIGG